MLRLVEEEAGLWERFQRAPEASFRALVPRSTELIPRWRRSVELGVAADGRAYPLGVAGHDLSVRREAALGALREGTQAIEALEAEVGARGLLTLVTDATGVIVRARGGDGFADDVRRIRLVEGARWDEGARGTNAIGTAIAEARPVAVVGRAHFESVNHGLFCYASPVIDAFGDVVAVVDVTGPLVHESESIAAFVRSAVQSIESLLGREAYASTRVGSRGFLERVLDRSSSPAVLVEAPGRVRRMNQAATRELGLELELDEEAHVERLFGTSWSDLVRASSGGAAMFETRRRSFEVEFESVLDARGRTLALLCFFERGVPHARPSRRVSASPQAAPLPAPFSTIVASDPALVAVKRTAAKLSSSDVPILLLAETGTGKELFARAIHQSSPRATRAFVAVNCGALSRSLLESELFGYAPGAFTGASQKGAEGKLAAADGGTLFLDELAEMPQVAQVMLLRFLEDGTYSRVGDSATRHANVRIVAATCRDLPRLVEEGAFRSDLFYRIHGGSVRLPPLRERTDRLELARALVATCAGARASTSAGGPAPTPALGASAESWVLDHPWPGNVRELKSAIQHALAMSTSGTLEVEDFPVPLVTSVSDAPPSEGKRQQALRTMAEGALARARGNMSEAARALGVARSTLYRMLRRPRSRED